MNELKQGLLLAGVAILVTLLLTYPVMWIWNTHLVPAIDGVNEIGFWQSFWLRVVVSILIAKPTINTSK